VTTKFLTKKSSLTINTTYIHKHSVKFQMTVKISTRAKSVSDTKKYALYVKSVYKQKYYCLTLCS